jgi:hypothetical protein
MSAWTNQARSRVPRIAEAAVERARLSVVPRAAARRSARVPFVVLVSLVLVGGVAGLLCFNTSMQQASFTATALEDRAAALDARQQSLTMQLDALRDPQRVAVRAQRLGMVPATSPAFIRLSDGTVLGSATPAAADGALRITPLPTRKPKDLRPAPIVVQADPATAPDGAATTGEGAATGTKKAHDRRPTQGSQR